MKICPHCQSTFSDDYVFCLYDGNMLAVDSEEQETLINRGIRANYDLAPTSFSTGDFCTSCGTENRPGAKFCKKCGYHAETFTSGGLQSASARTPHRVVVDTSNSGQNETIAFQPPAFAVPETRTTSSSTGRNKQLLAFAIVALAIALAMIGYVVVDRNQQSPRIGSNTVNTSPNENRTDSIASTLPSSFERTYTGTIRGKYLAMTLFRSGTELNGTATTSRVDKLYGTIDSEGRFEVRGMENDLVFTGIYSGRIFNDGSITGKWTTPEGTKETAFSLSQR